MARRSATECAGQLLVCQRLGLAEAPRVESGLDVLARVVAMWVALIKSNGERTSAGIDRPNEA
jgi:hypothetical protein